MGLGNTARAILPLRRAVLACSSRRTPGDSPRPEDTILPEDTIIRFLKVHAPHLGGAPGGEPVVDPNIVGVNFWGHLLITS